MSSAKKKKKAKYKQQHAQTDVSEKSLSGNTGSFKDTAKQQRAGSDNFAPVLPGSWKTNAGIFLSLVIVTLVLYSGDLRLGFFSVDDPGYVINNPWIKGFSNENISHIFGNPYFANYSPVHLLSYSLDYSLAGNNPYAFHLSNNIWAGIVAGFVFLVALAFTRRYVIAIAAAILFIVHPAHVEAVAWISSRKDLVAAAFALPSLLAYLYYRWDTKYRTRWYIISLLLFLCAAAGKLSVATFPAVFLALDLFVEKRSIARSVIDKIPFLLAAAVIAMAAASAQPDMGHRPDPFVLASALVQNLWLLLGFGNYVQYRVPPQPAGSGLEILSSIFLLALFIIPLLMRRRMPIVVVLIYWILFAFIPSQILSFTHPVADRYMFFPSVAGVILIAWGVIAALEKFFTQKGLIAGVALLLIIAIFWTKGTLDYLAEWRDPRSIWYAASKKSSDPIILQNLATHYMDRANRLGSSSFGNKLSIEEAKLIASRIWKDSSQLPQLIAEWEKGIEGGPVEKEFQNHLRDLATNAYEQAIARKGDRVMASLYYNRGLLYMGQDKLELAKKDFITASQELSRESFAAVQHELTVYCHYNLGVIAWKQQDFREALRWFRQAEEEQTRFGGNWMPGIETNIKKLEEIIASLPVPNPK